ncbi:MAG: discoidin domain-containing protein, partial [Abditibacteriaceae bacterium]
RNNTIKGGVFEYGARDHTNFPRVYNNTFVGPITLEMHASAPGRDYLIRNNIIEDGLTVKSKPITWDSLYCYKDTFTGGETNAKLVDCVVKGTATAVKPHYNLAQSLALNKPVTATGFEGDSIPANAVDGFTGKKQGWWGATAPASLTVDLEKIYPIDRIKIYTYFDGTRYYQYTVEASTDNKNWTQVVDMSANIKPSTEEGDTFTFKPVQGRYVRVNMIKNSANIGVHVLELQVFADKQTGK